MVLAGERKKEEYAKPRTEGREVSYGKIGPTTVAVTQDLLSGMLLVLRIELIRHWNSILPEPGQPSAELFKLIRLTACKKAMHATSRWYRTVYIPWLVASNDTHKGKRWLNSNPPNHRAQDQETYPLGMFPLFLIYFFLTLHCSEMQNIIVIHVVSKEF